MKKFIVSLFIVVLILLALLYVFRNAIAKPLIEREASKAYGAEVNIGDIDIDVFDSAVTLLDIQVTDRGDAMRNMVKLDRAYANIAPMPLLRQLVEITDLQLDQVIMYAPRSSAGSISKPLPTDESSISLNQLQMPDVDDLVAQQRQRIEGELQTLQDNFALSEDKWREKLKNLPDESTVEDYKARIKAVSSKGNLLEKLASAGELKAVYEDVRKDVKQLESTRSEFDSDVATMRSQLKQAGDLPSAISGELMKSVGLNDAQLNALGSSLLKGDFEGLARQLLPPADSSGDSPASSDSGSAYDILVHQATFSGPLLAATPDLAVNGELRDFHWPLENASKAATLKVREGASSAASVLIDASLDHRSTISDSLKIDLAKLPLKDLVLGRSNDVVFELIQALAKAAGSFQIDGDSINGQLDTHISQAMIKAQLADSADSKSLQLAAKALEAAKEFNIRLGVAGTLSQPEFEFSADLDKLLNSAMQVVMQDQIGELSEEVANRLQQELGPQLATVGEKMQLIDSLDEQLQLRQQLLDKLTP